MKRIILLMALALIFAFNIDAVTAISPTTFANEDTSVLSFDSAQDDRGYALSFDSASSFDYAQDDKMLVWDNKMNGHVRSLRDSGVLVQDEKIIVMNGHARSLRNNETVIWNNNYNERTNPFRESLQQSDLNIMKLCKTGKSGDVPEIVFIGNIDNNLKQLHRKY